MAIATENEVQATKAEDMPIQHEVEMANDKNSNSTDEEELVVTPKTWIVVFVSQAMSVILSV
jgi:hypothetical protein